MNLQITTEEKITLLRIALKTTDIYHDRVYKLYQYCDKLLHQIKTGEAKCKNVLAAIIELDYLRDQFQAMASRYDNYKAVMNQIADEKFL